MRIKVVERKLGRHCHAKGMKMFGQAWVGDGLIEIDPRQSPKERMDTLIHECLHLLYPEESEEAVSSAGSSIAAVLWRDGYRRIEK